MKELSIEQSSVALVGDINDNLQEIGSDSRVAVTMSASELISALNAVFADVDGKRILSVDDNAATFISNLNVDFALAAQGASVIDAFDGSVYENEMADTITKVNELKNNADLILMVSTDLHYERDIYTELEKNGTVYNVPLRNGRTDVAQFPDTFSPMMSNHKEFLKRAAANGITVDGIANLGDWFDGHRVDYVVSGETIMSAEDIITEYIGRMIRPYNELKSKYGVPLIFALGNHDDNVDEKKGYVPSSFSELYGWFLNGNVVPTGSCVASSGLDYYIDYAAAKIRVVVLFCEESLSFSSSDDYRLPDANNWNIPSKSVAYLKDCVNGLESDSKGDYKVLILSHTHPSMGRGTQYYQNPGDSGYGTVEFMKYVGEHTDKIIGHLCGHNHSDGGYSYPVMSFRLLCGKSYSSCQHNDGKDLWSVVAIDTNAKIINIIRFGGTISSSNRSGVDFIMHYGQPVPDTVGGNTYTFVANLQRIGYVLYWGVGASSWCGWGYRSDVSNGSYGGLAETSAPYYSLDAENQLKTDHQQGYGVTSFTVTAIPSANNTDHPQCLLIYVVGTLATEYWRIEIPKQSNS